MFFSIYIPFKGSQSHVIFAQRCNWHCCAIHSGVIDTAVHVTSVSLIPLCRVRLSQISLKKKQCVGLFAQMFEKTLVAQRCQWHRCNMHSVIIDTGVTGTAVLLTQLCTNFVDYLREFEKAVTRVSGAWGKLFDEKNQRSKISCQGPFKVRLPSTILAKQCCQIIEMKCMPNCPLCISVPYFFLLRAV
jgi:hypothetical protein